MSGRMDDLGPTLTCDNYSYKMHSFQDCSCSSTVFLSCMRCSQFPGHAMASLLRQFHLHLVLGFNYVICSCVNDYCCSRDAAAMLIKGVPKDSHQSDFISLETARDSVYLPHCVGSDNPGSTTMAGTVSHGAPAHSGLGCWRIYFLNVHSTSY